MRAKTLLVVYAAIVIVAIARVASTGRVFSEVIDEPAHIATGLEWLAQHHYRIDVSHPPLERVLSAVPAWLSGVPFPTEETNFVLQGNKILYTNDRYQRNLSRARYPNLLFLLVLILGTAGMARRVFPEPIPLISAAVVSLLPPLLGHSGVATTDIAVTALLPVASIALDRWLERGGRTWDSIALGGAIGLGILSKFSFFVFFPIVAIVLIALRRKRIPVRPALLAIVVAGLAVWAGYRFSVGRVTDHFPEDWIVGSAPGFLQPAARFVARKVPIPAPELPAGMGLVALHNRSGHLAFLLGRYSEKGFWYYFPTLLFYKTPLPFLALALWGFGVVLRKRLALQFALVPLLMLASVMRASINIGVRHILPVYPWLAVAAAAAIANIWANATDVFARTSLIALIVWLAVNSATAHPDYLAWFNEAAGEHPEQIAVDSNLDWGQDVIRLQRTADRLHIDSMSTNVFSSAALFPRGTKAEALPGFTPVNGWVAVSESALVLLGRNGEFRWLDAYRPVARVGKTIRLYRIP